MREQSRPWWLAGTLLSLLVLGCADDPRRDVEAALKEAEAHQQASRWCEARVALARAEGRLGKGGPEALRKRVEQMRKDIELVARLEAVRLSQANVKGWALDRAGADARYARAFRDHGIDVTALKTEEAARRVRESSRRQELLAALDDWAMLKRDGEARKALWAVADAADDNAWRMALRKALASGDSKALVKLAREPGAATQPPAVLVLLGEALARAGWADEAIRLLRRGQERYPADFWLNETLGMLLLSLHKGSQAEAVGYYRAALALRPDSPAVHINLGSALLGQGKLDEASNSFRRAVALAPTLAAAHLSLGAALARQGKLPEAEACYRHVIRLDSKYAPAHNQLGIALASQGKLDEAVACYRRAIQLDPRVASAHLSLGNALHQKGDLDGAIACFKEAIALDPRYAGAHNKLGNALHRKGQVDEAIACYRRAIALSPNDAQAHTNLGNALVDKGQLDEAIVSCRKAVALDPKLANAHAVLGLALFGKRRYAEARAAYARALELLPDKHPLRAIYSRQVRDCERLMEKR
jgi:tetratricopeptide (TPR) repeat protein